ncbi:MAG: gliding motility-associated ABC transporter ATP-binding subunit GldA [Flammeovirgaceae bacterium]|nr:MAG: gliding motility-associated ABC transporter ATP-binding subunit GldA [Flammeovirgaceae bacterium]
MSLVVNKLTKVYGTQYAINTISFEVSEGEIVAFLGPNGAGKSTTMKIATGFLAATSGTVLVNGMDVAHRPMDVKRMTGYLPEHNPLYVDMYVHEYLAFTGRLYGLSGKRLRNRVGQMIDLCGLTVEQNKKIEALSKGYRQRVGLAQALLHDPKVLILDEPTSGLDPNQLVEIRKLIKEVSKNKTVLFSTHIMQEVQALCDRVIVINKGSIVADAGLSELVGKDKTRSLIIEFEEPVSVGEIEVLPGVVGVRQVAATVVEVIPQQGFDVRPSIFKFSTEQGNSLVGLRWDENSLESVFAELTRNVSS